jgi:hypothetical protein
MRRKNMRIVVVGAVLIVLAIGFYVVMLSMAAKSTDPKALMETVGTVSGVLIGISVAMIVVGLIGKKE